MRIDAFEIFRYRLPLVAPLPLAHGTLAERAGVLIRLVDEAGREAWGEAAPLPGFSREALAEAVAELRALRAAWLAEGFDLDPLLSASPSVRFAVGQVLQAWLGWDVPARARVAVNGLLVGERAMVLKSAAQLRAAGYRSVKLKVGRQAVAEDAALARDVAVALGPEVELRLDANRAWSFDEAVAFAEGVAGVPLAYVEEPLAEPERLAELVGQTALPVALDETLASLPVAALAAHAYARAVVLKPMLVGGLGYAEALAREAGRLGMTAVVSASFESGVGLRALVALAARQPAETAHGLDTYRHLAADVFAERLPLAGPEVDVAAVLAERPLDHARLEPL